MAADRLSIDFIVKFDLTDLAKISWESSGDAMQQDYLIYRNHAHERELVRARAGGAHFNQRAWHKATSVLSLGDRLEPKSMQISGVAIRANRGRGRTRSWVNRNQRKRNALREHSKSGHLGFL